MNKIIEEPDFRCEHCGSETAHKGHCPSVKAIEYFKDGTIKRIDYMTPIDYPQFGLSLPSAFGAPNQLTYWDQAQNVPRNASNVKGRT